MGLILFAVAGAVVSMIAHWLLYPWIHNSVKKDEDQ